MIKRGRMGSLSMSKMQCWGFEAYRTATTVLERFKKE